MGLNLRHSQGGQTKPDRGTAEVAECSQHVQVRLEPASLARWQERIFRASLRKDVGWSQSALIQTYHEEPHVRPKWPWHSEYCSD